MLAVLVGKSDDTACCKLGLTGEIDCATGVCTGTTYMNVAYMLCCVEILLSLSIKGNLPNKRETLT